MMKRKLIEKYIEALEEKYQSAKKAYEVARHDTIEAEGRMVTRYDSTKTETAWLADGYQKNMLELVRGIDCLKNDVISSNFYSNVELMVYKQGEFFETQYIRIDEKLKEENNDLFVKVIGLAIEERFSLQVGGQMYEYIVRKIENVEDIDCVGIDSLVTIVDEDGCVDYFYIVREFGGVQLEIDDKEIYCLARQALMANALLGHNVGDTIIVNDVSYTIKEMI